MKQEQEQSMSFNFINIVGYGYVGSSLGYLLKKNTIPFTITDVQRKDEPSAHRVFDNVTDTVKFSESKNQWNTYFVCVPTPSRTNGECNTDVVEDVVNTIYKTSQKHTTVFVKSTVQPRTCRQLFNKYNSDQFNIVFVPEFLTEKRAHLDMYEAKFALVGTHDGKECTEVVELFRCIYSHNPQIEIITKKFEVCELFKYTVNVFLATKVWFFNEIYELSEKLEFEYNDLRDILRLDPRIGESHTQVPGHDGKFGFGLGCLPKEILASSFLQNQNGIPNTVLETIIERNKTFRNKDV